MDWIVWGLLAGVVVLGLMWQKTRRQRDRARDEVVRVSNELQGQRGRFDAALREVTDVWLPRAVASRSGVDSAERAAPSTGDRGLDERLAALLETVVEFTEMEQRTASSVVRAVASGIQNRVAELSAVLAQKQRRYDDPGVVEALQELEHRASQVYQNAQQAAMLVGAWPGQQRPPTPVADVVRGAAGRIRDFARVRVRGTTAWAVDRRYVEPVLVALAAVLDNAATNSRPDQPVEVNVHPVPAGGVSIIIDDHGTGLTAEETLRATYLLEQADHVDLGELGDPPRLGWAVVGQTARRYGFRVFADLHAPYGGVRVVLRVPEHMLLSVPETLVPMPAPSSTGTSHGQTRHGLPKRSRRARHALETNQLAAHNDTGTVAQPAESTERFSAGRGDTATVFAQFARAGATPSGEGTDTSNGEHT